MHLGIKRLLAARGPGCVRASPWHAAELQFSKTPTPTGVSLPSNRTTAWKVDTRSSSHPRASAIAFVVSQVCFYSMERLAYPPRSALKRQMCSSTLEDTSGS